MKDVDDLTESAAELTEQGLSKGEIADELNVSRETAAWLIERSGTTRDRDAATGDVHVDWSTIGRDADRLSAVGGALADVLTGHGEVDLTVGIEKAGTPLATVVARELETDLATYAPSKHQWEGGDLDDAGTFSRNFARVDDQECFLVDDIVTSGTTLRETVSAVRERGGDPVACAVLVDKRGVDEADLDGVPVRSLFQVIPVGDAGQGE